MKPTKKAEKSAEKMVPIKCVTLTVKVQGENGNPVKGCEAMFHVHGGWSTGWWKLEIDGESRQIYSILGTCYVSVRGKSGDKPFQTSVQENGIEKDTTYVFVVKPCP